MEDIIEELKLILLKENIISGTEFINMDDKKAQIEILKYFEIVETTNVIKNKRMKYYILKYELEILIFKNKAFKEKE